MGTLGNYFFSRIEGKKKSILDVGCGFGYFLELAGRKGWQISGVEIVGTAVAGAKARVGSHYMFHGILKEAKFPDNSFDVITLWDVLFHVSNPFEELKECFRVLKGRGIIGIRVRNVRFEKMAYRAHWLIKKMVPSLRIKAAYVFHRYCFSSNSMSQLLN
jgi:2-polyprenyl-3-methyl-5-hydroxy-6-metoxy-1,4-benzoquinol methylase